MIDVPQDLLAVLERLRERGRPYLVGGCVRDALWGNQPKDFDVEVFGMRWDDLLAILQQFGPTNVVGRSFAVAKLRLASGQHDFGLPRRESKTGAGHRGFRIEVDPALTEREACLRRDFTINALLYDPFSREVMDWVGGREDLERQRLRHTSGAFVEDPLRVLRAFQFAARFGLTLHDETSRLCASVAESFEELPVERVWTEWEKFASQATVPSLGLRALKETQWLRHFPELAALDGLAQEPDWHPEGDVFSHIGHCLDALVGLSGWRDEAREERRVLTFAVLGHDFGKAGTTVRAEKHGTMRWMSPGHDRAGGPKVEAFLARVGSPLEMRPVVRALVENHHAHQSWPPEGPTAAAVRRLSRKIAPATINQLLIVMSADHLGRPPLVSAETATRLQQLRETAAALAVADAAPEPLLRGRDLVQAGMRPGPAMGLVLRSAYEAQLDGAFDSTDGALGWARSQFPDVPR